MAREIRVIIWCDLCMHLDDLQIEGEEVQPIGVGRAKPKVMAVCAEHKKSFYDVFVDTLAEIGTAQDALDDPTAGRVRSSANRPAKAGIKSELETSTGKRVQCPFEDCGAKLKNYQTTASHIRQVHHSNIYETIGKDGQLYDVDGDPIDMPEVRARTGEPEIKVAKCEQPGCDMVYSHPENQRPIQALGVHMAKTHKIPGVAKGKKVDAA